MISVGSFGMGPESILPKRGIFVSKRKNWVAYCVLTVLAVILYIVFAKESIRLEHYLAAGRGHLYYVFYAVILGFPLLWSMLMVIRSGCYTKAVTTKSGLIPEIAVFLLVILLIIGMFTIGLRQYYHYLKDFYEGRALLYPSLLAGFALGDVILGIRKLRNNDTEQGRGSL